MVQNPFTEFAARPSGGENRLEAHVYLTLFDKIRFGKYELGQRLPTEAELSEEFSVSRPVVRAALAKLRDSGLIVSRQGSGSFVTSGVPTSAGGFTPLSSVVDIARYFQFRRIIEGSSAELAATRAGASGVAALREIVEEIRTLLSREQEAVAQDMKFHQTIANLSDNRFLSESFEMLQPHMIFVGNFVRSLGMTGRRKGTRMTQEHLAIVDAIEKADAAAARRAMEAHLDGSERRVFKGEP